MSEEPNTMPPVPPPARHGHRRRAMFILLLAGAVLAGVAWRAEFRERLTVRWMINKLRHSDENRRRAAMDDLIAYAWPAAGEPSSDSAPPPEVRTGERYVRVIEGL